MLYLLLGLIIICCLGVIFFIVWKKSDKLKQASQEVDPKEKMVEVKKRLVESRLRKRLAELWETAVGKVGGATGTISGALRKVKLARKAKPNRLEKRRKIETKTESMVELTEGQVLLRQRKLEEAEKKFISALKTDIKNMDAYMGLGEVYVAKKDWSAAVETYQHVIRIDPKCLLAYKELISVLAILKNWNEIKRFAEKVHAFGFKEAWVYSGMGLAYRRTGYPEKAEEWYEKAVATEPNNEKYLDCLLEVSIINKNRALAYKTFNTLRQISRDEIKLQDYRNKIEIL